MISGVMIPSYIFKFRGAAIYGYGRTRIGVDSGVVNGAVDAVAGN